MSGPLAVILAYSAYALIDNMSVAFKNPNRKIATGVPEFDMLPLSVQVAAIDNVVPLLFLETAKPHFYAPAYGMALQAIFEYMRSSILHGRVKTKVCGPRESDAFRELLKLAFMQRYPGSFHTIPDNDRWELHCALVGVLASGLENTEREPLKLVVTEHLDLDQAKHSIQSRCKDVIEKEWADHRNSDVALLRDSISRREQS